MPTLPSVPVSNEAPELLLLELERKIGPGAVFHIRVGAFDDDENLEVIYRLDSKNNVVEEFRCTGGVCLHTFQVRAPEAYDTPFTETFLAIDQLGLESELLVVRGTTRGKSNGGSNSGSGSVKPPNKGGGQQP